MRSSLPAASNVEALHTGAQSRGSDNIETLRQRRGHAVGELRGRDRKRAVAQLADIENADRDILGVNGRKSVTVVLAAVGQANRNLKGDGALRASISAQELEAVGLDRDLRRQR